MAVSAVRRSFTRRWEQRMSDGLYVTSCEPGTGRAAVSLGLFDLLVRRVDRLGVFRPVVSAGGGSKPSLDLLLPRFPQPGTYEACPGGPDPQGPPHGDKAKAGNRGGVPGPAPRCGRGFG